MKKAASQTGKPPDTQAVVRYPAALVGSAVLVAALSVAASLGAYGASARYQQAHRDTYQVAIQVERFALARQALAPTSVIGYISDLPLTATAGSAAFQSAQYALAPRLLVDANASPAPEKVIGNFSQPRDLAAAGATFGLELEKDFGNGVVLYRRLRK